MCCRVQLESRNEWRRSGEIRHSASDSCDFALGRGHHRQPRTPRLSPNRISPLTFCPGGTLRGSRIGDKAIRCSWAELSLLSRATPLPNSNPPEPDEYPRYCPVRRVPSPLPSTCCPLPTAHSWRRERSHFCDWGARRGTRPVRARADAKSVRRNLAHLSRGCGPARRMGLLDPRWKHEAESGRGFECWLVLFLSIFL